LPTHIGFLSFGIWRSGHGSQTRNASDAHLQTIELAENAERIGLDAAYLRVHHFADQLASPYPLLAAIGARTTRIEIGTAVIDMRYENPLHMAELAGAADLISGGRLQLGIGRGLPERGVVDGPAAFGNVPREGQSADDMAREHTERFRAAIAGEGVVRAAAPASQPAGPPGGGIAGSGIGHRKAYATHLPIQPQSPGLSDRIWWGSATKATARWIAEQGMNLQTATVLTNPDVDVPFHEAQADMIRVYREAWAAAGWERAPRVSVGRSVIPLVDDVDRAHFGDRGPRDFDDQTSNFGGNVVRHARNYVGEPDEIADLLARDAAVAEADTLMLAIPSHLGVDYNTQLLQNVADHVAPAIGWQPSFVAG